MQKGKKATQSTWTLGFRLSGWWIKPLQRSNVCKKITGISLEKFNMEGGGTLKKNHKYTNLDPYQMNAWPIFTPIWIVIFPTYLAKSYSLPKINSGQGFRRSLESFPKLDSSKLARASKA